TRAGHGAGVPAVRGRPDARRRAGAAVRPAGRAGAGMVDRARLARGRAGLGVRRSPGAGAGGEPAVTARTTAASARFVRRVRLPAEASTGRYPFTLPAVAWLARSQ